MAGVLRRETFSSKPVFSFEDLEGQARVLLDQARAQAQEIVTQAEERGRRRVAEFEREARPRVLEEGRRQGFEQARAEAAETAIQEARQDVARLTEALATGLDAFEADKRRLLAAAECGLLELALAIARRVCKHDVGASSAAARANARALLAMVKHEEDLELHLNPAEHDKLREATDLTNSVDHLAHAKIVADPAVQRGGCVLHSRDGTIDASLETQLDRVAEALLGKRDDDQ